MPLDTENQPPAPPPTSTIAFGEVLHTYEPFAVVRPLIEIVRVKHNAEGEARRAVLDAQTEHDIASAALHHAQAEAAAMIARAQAKLDDARASRSSAVRAYYNAQGETRDALMALDDAIQGAMGDAGPIEIDPEKNGTDPVLISARVTIGPTDPPEKGGAAPPHGPQGPSANIGPTDPPEKK